MIDENKKRITGNQIDLPVVLFCVRMRICEMVILDRSVSSH